MSGQLVGEVGAAREDGRLAGLSQNEVLVLVAVAEKCHTDSRQGSVRTAYIAAWIGKSVRTTERTVRALKDRGLIRVVKHGYISHGEGHSTVYELAVLPPLKVAEAPEYAPATHDGGSTADVLPPKSDVLPPKSDVLPPPMDGGHDGLNDGLNDGGASPKPGTSPADREPLERPPEDSDPETELPMRCPKHINDPNPPDCGQCKAHRLAREAQDARKAERRAERAAAAKTARLACPWCEDETGHWYDADDLAHDFAHPCDHPAQPPPGHPRAAAHNGHAIEVETGAVLAGESSGGTAEGR